MSRLRALGGHADAIVRYHDDDARRIGLNADVHMRCLSVSQGIDQAFLHHSVDRKRDAWTQLSCKIMLQRQADRRIAPSPVSDEVLQGVREPQGIKRQRHETWNE